MAHHLFRRKDNFLLEFSLLNGVPLTSAIHKDYQQKFGIKSCPKSFVNYLELLDRENLISQRSSAHKYRLASLNSIVGSVF